MIRMTVVEFRRIDRSSLPAKVLRRLQRFDQRQASETGKAIFDWSRADYIAAQNYVGVIEVPGLQIEILPKIDDDEGEMTPDGLSRAQNNLLWMLHVAGELPFEHRESAAQEHQRSPLLEVLVRLFTTKLLAELRRGIYNRYVYQEDCLNVVRGRLLMSKQICHSAGRNDRVHVGFDEFIPDNLLNRILKAACRCLLSKVNSTGNQTRLREALIELAEVADVEIRPYHFEQLHLDRTNSRFEDLVRFAWLVLRDRSISMAGGGFETFSILFPMETVFEQFVGRLLTSNAEQFGWERSRVHLQARSRRRCLLRDENDRPRFGLKPDVLVDDEVGSKPALILDTKWKRLLTDAEDRKNGVRQSDLYQLYAYANRYQCQNCVLLYPDVDGVSNKNYQLDGFEEAWNVRIAVLNLNRNLPADKALLIDDLADVVRTSIAV